MTSLAVKGTVGIGCMGALADLMNNTADSTRYTALAKQYATQVVSSSMASTKDHLKLTYNAMDSSWSSLYNMMPDKIFNLGVFDEDVYQMQGQWYGKQARKYKRIDQYAKTGRLSVSFSGIWNPA